MTPYLGHISNHLEDLYKVSSFPTSFQGVQAKHPQPLSISYVAQMSKPPCENTFSLLHYFTFSYQIRPPYLKNLFQLRSEKCLQQRQTNVWPPIFYGTQKLAWSALCLLDRLLTLRTKFEVHTHKYPEVSCLLILFHHDLIPGGPCSQGNCFLLP